MAPILNYPTTEAGIVMTTQNLERELIGDFFKRKRIAAGLTQTFLAKKLGWTTSQFISNWERGLAIPPKKIINKLVELCKIDTKEMMNIYAEAARLEIDALLNNPKNQDRTLNKALAQMPTINYTITSRYLNKAIETLDNITSLFKKNNLEITPYSNRSITDFSGLSEPKKIDVISQLHNYQEFARAMAPKFNQHKTEAKHEVSCLQASLNGLGLKTGDDDFSFIDSGDIVEVYGIDGKQQYRNFEFIKLCPYDLLMVHTHEWYVLYERAPETNLQINQYIKYVIGSDCTKSIPFDIPKHLLLVPKSEEEAAFSVNLKWIKPLFNLKTEIKTGFVATLLVEPIDKNKYPLPMPMSLFN